MVSVEEYLTTSYEIDCEYVDDHIEERNVGAIEHSSIQFETFGFLREQAKRMNFSVFGETRIKVAEGRYRVPDLCVMLGRRRMSGVITEPPLVVIEVLFTEDRPGGVVRRLRDFVTVGVPHIGIVDPFERAAMVFENDALRLQDDGILTAPEIPITINLAERFAAIDE